MQVFYYFKIFSYLRLFKLIITICKTVVKNSLVINSKGKTTQAYIDKKKRIYFHMATSHIITSSTIAKSSSAGRHGDG